MATIILPDLGAMSVADLDRYIVNKASLAAFYLAKGSLAAFYFAQRRAAQEEMERAQRERTRKLTKDCHQFGGTT